MKRTGLFGLLAYFLLSAVFVSAQTTTESNGTTGLAAAQYRAGAESERRGDYVSAIKSYQQALILDPNFAPASNNLCAAYSKISNYQAALTACREAVRIKSDYAPAYRNLGRVYDLLGQPDDAIAALKEAVKLDPLDPLPNYDLGGIFNDLGQYSDAAAAFAQAVKVKPDYFEAYNNLGCIYYRLKRYPESADSFQHAHQLKPDSIATLANLGAALSDWGHPIEAIAVFKQAVALSPKRADLYYSLASEYYLLHRWQDAEENCQQALAVDPDYAEARLCLGAVYLIEKNKEAALAQYQKLQVLNYAMASELFQAIYKDQVVNVARR